MYASQAWDEGPTPSTRTTNTHGVYFFIPPAFRHNSQKKSPHGRTEEEIKKIAPRRVKFLKMAGPTRLERATSSVTGRRSNQLSYEPALRLVYTKIEENASRKSRIWPKRKNM